MFIDTVVNCYFCWSKTQTGVDSAASSDGCIKAAASCLKTTLKETSCVKSLCTAALVIDLSKKQAISTHKQIRVGDGVTDLAAAAVED